jgi:hypothetical protein
MTNNSLPFAFLLILILGSGNVFAQRHGAYAGVGTEITVSGEFLSFQAGVELNRHRIGLVYEIPFSNEEDPFDSEDYNFKALLYEFTFYREKNIQLGALLRGGFSNDDFVVIVPALSTGFIFNDYLKINVITGIRGEKPAFGINLFFNLPFKKHEFPYPVFKH